MHFKIIAVAAWVVMAAGSSAVAQTVAQIGGPRELPPASFQGQQYVDSRGCVFLRAGYGGRVSWVPRVDSRRQALCGFPPTFGPHPIEVAEEPSAPVATDPGPPMETVASAMMPRAVTVVAPRVVIPVFAETKAAPYADTRPTGTYEVAATGPGKGKIGCYTSVPVAERVKLSNGGTAVVCTRGDGGVSGWRPPIYPAGAGVGAALSDPMLVARDAGGVSGMVAAGDYSAQAAAAVPVPPKGYKLAWDDDRLNPARGKGTALGQAAQDQVWTRDVPAVLVAEQPGKKPRNGSTVTVSTKTEPTRPAVPAVQPSGAHYVQVGTFGVPENAAGASQRLAALGLPVSKGKMTKGGKTLQIVYAGPFASSAEAQAALRVARGAGFGDAILR